MKCNDTLKLCRLFFIGLSAPLLLCVDAQARQLSPDEAIRKISSDMVGALTRSNPVPLYTQMEGELTAAYVFPASSSDGYVVVAADDLLPAVLGYSDCGGFDSASIPPAMEAWLAEYGRQLAYAVKNGLEAAPSRAGESRLPIPPLCSAKWNQSRPYNNNCPEIDGKHAPTGCTATAMAQVMYAHKWPEKGTGSNTYLSGVLRQKMTFDFGATVFKWDDILPSYASDYTPDQGEAVATLMEACGNAALMSYGAKASGAYPYDAIFGMVSFLNYDKSALMLERDYYSSAIWDDIIYSELAEGRPVIYGGYNSSYQSGHTFIVDGYSEKGFYHLNWGWGGMSDGYFLLTGLDPKEQGIGGSASGYNFKQDAIINIMPAKEDSDYELEVMWEGPFSTAKASYRNGNVEFVAGDNGYFKWFTLNDTKATMGIMLTPVQGGEPVFYPGNEVDFVSFYGETSEKSYEKFTVPVSDLPKEGEYIVTPAFSYNGGVKDVAVKVGETKALKMTCSSIGVKFEDVKVERTLSADNIKVLNTLYSGKNCSVEVTIHNSGEEYLGVIKAGFVNDQGSVRTWLGDIPVNLTDGESVTLTFSGVLNSYAGVLPAGEYILNIFDEAGNSICENPIDVTVKEVPDGNLKYDMTFEIQGCESGDGTSYSPYFIGDNIDLDVTVNVSSGLFDDVVALYAYTESGADVDFTTSTVYYHEFFVEPGKSQTMNYNLGTSEFDLDKTIYIQAYGWKTGMSSSSLGWIGRKIFVKRVSGDVDTISDIKAEGSLSPNPATTSTFVSSLSSIKDIRVYSITGSEVLHKTYGACDTVVELDVTSLPAGHYVVIVTTDNGAERHRLIKK